VPATRITANIATAFEAAKAARDTGAESTTDSVRSASSPATARAPMAIATPVNASPPMAPSISLYAIIDASASAGMPMTARMASGIAW